MLSKNLTKGMNMTNGSHRKSQDIWNKRYNFPF